MQNISNITALLNLVLGFSTIAQEFIATLKDVTMGTTLDRAVNTILYTSNENYTTHESISLPQSSLILRSLAIALKQPLLNFDAQPPTENFRKHFNAELLTIAKLSGFAALDEQLLSSLWKRLWSNTQSRLILLLDNTASASYVASILRWCVKHQAMNVIALQPAMALINRNYWTVRLFPTLKVIQSSFSASYRNMFPEHLKNMHGQPLRIIRTTLHPSIYNYTTKNGVSTLSGYYGRTLAEYAYRHNATIDALIIPRPKNHTFSAYVDLLSNDTIDIAPLVPSRVLEFNLNSGIMYLHAFLCLMVPLEPPLPRSDFYHNIIYKTAVILLCVTVVLISSFWAFISRWQRPSQKVPFVDYFVNVSVVQGLLGASFLTSPSISRVHNIICSTIWIAGIIIATAYNAYLQSFSVDAPISAPYETIHDLLNVGIKLAISVTEAPFLCDSAQFREYADNFTVFDNFTIYQTLRDNLDTRYAYLVADMWGIYDEQQQYFSRPIFRLSEFCIGKSYRLLLPLQENSLHLEYFNLFIPRLREAGLINHWWRHSFLEFLDMDLFFLEDVNKKRDFEQLKLEDLHLVFKAVGALMIISLVCFVFEIIWKKIRE